MQHNGDMLFEYKCLFIYNTNLLDFSNKSFPIYFTNFTMLVHKKNNNNNNGKKDDKQLA